jgi:hypothetical protein
VYNSWIFPQNEQEMKESKRQPTKYLSFPEEFKQLILRKELQGLVIWLKPDCDYHIVSKQIQQIEDPVTSQKYNALNLNDQYWKKEFTKGRYTNKGESVLVNYKLGEHDYYPVMELLYQSNQTMEPILQWKTKN